ncbi:zonular occludens toxin domain-containing protein [Pseudoalteromonas sp.]|uniref:zonular occludens toxin domain-containing protein n=1 Tax=Pseudoalteromonas sp. TaxID=53249 RepID=UPI00356432E6
MIYLRTGVPGAGKTLNTIKEICQDARTTQKTKFYNNIKAFLLDIDVCNSFQGFFYGVIWPEVLGTKQQKTYSDKIKDIHSQNRLCELSDFPWLSSRYAQYDTAAAIDLFVSWCKRCYPKSNLQPLEEYISNADDVTIDGLKLLNYHWTMTHSVDTWYDLPNGAIAVFDECQDHFPPLANSAKRPLHYTKFQTHRHSGFDIHLITQHYTFLDSHIQKTTNKHVHYYQLFGSQRVTRFEKDRQFNTDNPRDRDLCIKTQFNRDKSYYGVYWSADEHTSRFKMPPILFLGLVVLAIIGLCLYGLYQNLYVNPIGTDKTKDKKTQNLPVQQTQTQTNFLKQTDKKVLYTDKVIHPLSKLCKSYEYAGHKIIKRGNLVDVEHMINCVTGDTQIKKDTQTFTIDGEERQTDKAVEEPIVRLLKQDYLERLGYKIDLLGSMPVLQYSNKEIILEAF